MRSVGGGTGASSQQNLIASLQEVMAERYEGSMEAGAEGGKRERELSGTGRVSGGAGERSVSGGREADELRRGCAAAEGTAELQRGGQLFFGYCGCEDEQQQGGSGAAGGGQRGRRGEADGIERAGACGADERRRGGPNERGQAGEVGRGRS